MSVIQLPAITNAESEHVFASLHAAAIASREAVTKLREFVHGDSSYDFRSQHIAINNFFQENRNFLQSYIETVYGKRTIDMVKPLIGRYWTVRENAVSNPFAIIYPYELSGTGAVVMSSLVVYLDQPNYQCALSTKHLHILSPSDATWSSTLHFTEITEKEFHQTLEDGINNIFAYRDFKASTNK